MPVRKIPRNYRHPTGVVALGDNKTAAFEGTPERDFVILARADPDFLTIESQPVRIQYRMSNGKLTHYTPDYLVIYRADSGRRPQLIEVKSRDELREKWSEFRPRFKAAVQVCRDRSWVFKIMTDTKIRTPRLQNLKRLKFHEREAPNELKAQRILRLVREMPNPTFDGVLSVVATTMQERVVWLPALWSMIARRHLYTDLDVLISGRSSLSVDQ